MKFTIAIEAGTKKSAFGVAVPDLPPAEKINITVPGRLLRQIDDFAKSHGETRSGFLTKAALEAMRK